MATDQAIAMEAMTPKQREVLDLLTAGQRPPAIAKKLKLTRSSVYNHMRNMRKMGVSLPNEQITDPVAPVPPTPVAASNGASANGYADPVESLRAARAAQERRLDEIAEEVTVMREREEKLSEERTEVEGFLTRVVAATKALTA